MEKFKQPKYYDRFTIIALYLFALFGFWFVYKVSPSPSESKFGNGNILLLIEIFYVIPIFLVANLYLNRELQKWHFYKDLGKTYLICFILFVLLIFLACIGGEVWFIKNLVAQIHANPNLPDDYISFGIPSAHENRIYFNCFTFIGFIALTFLFGSVKQYFSVRNQDKN